MYFECITPDGKTLKKTHKSIKAGDNKFAFKPFPKGEYKFRVWAKELKSGLESHRVWQRFRVLEPKDLVIPDNKIYTVTDADLEKYSISNKGDFGRRILVEVPEHPKGTRTPEAAKKNKEVVLKYVSENPAKNTDGKTGYTIYIPARKGEIIPNSFRACHVVYDPTYDTNAVEQASIKTAEGLNQLLKDKAAEGFRKIVLLPGTYRISYKRTVSIPSNVTLDLNGCTLSETVTDSYGAIYIGTAGNLTITDSATGGKIATDGGIVVGNYGTVTVAGGTIEAGETADLGVVLNNLGNEIAVKVKGNLSSSNNDITINQTEAEFSSIGANSSGVAFFNVKVSESISNMNIPFTIKTSNIFKKEHEFSHNYTNACTYIFHLQDSYQDGWNGAALLVKYDNGKPTDTLTINYGGFQEYRISIESNVEVTLEWMGKDQYDKECSFAIATEYYTAVYSSPALSPSTTYLYSWVNDCSCKNEYAEMCDAVKELKAELNGNNIVLSWSTDNGQQTTVYEVYRGTKLLRTTEETTFVDEGSDNDEYVYSVRAIYEDCKGLFSDVTFTNTESTIENSAISASIYPNPSRDNFTIVCDDMTYIAVYNVVGSKIMETNVNGNIYVINDLNSGVYFIEIKTNEGSAVKRIVKL